ncbi:MAG: pilus assembly protein PilZ [Alphaproteobacteria bacterium]|nr:MAG: pilus assembly protein PilZ [Alphaproteobacteria bacterium]
MRLAAALERKTEYDRRRYVRVPVRVGAGLTDNARPASPITVVDLSCGGCGIESDLELAVGSRVWLKLPGLESWPCLVTWSDGPRAGLAFDRPFHPAVLERFTGG